VAADFDATAVKEAIREAQTLVPGYTYKGFITKVAGPVSPAIWFHSLVDAFFTSRGARKPTSNIFLRQNSLLGIEGFEQPEEP
jgi:hypothetical protein